MMRKRRGTDLNMKDYMADQSIQKGIGGKTKLTKQQHLLALQRQTELEKLQRNTQNKSNAFSDIMGDDNEGKLVEINKIAVLLDSLD